MILDDVPESHRDLLQRDWSRPSQRSTDEGARSRPPCGISSTRTAS